MTATIYTATIFDEPIQMRGNFAEASSPVEWGSDDDGWRSPHGMQVADFRHSPELAMRQYLEEMIRAGGDDPAEYEKDIVEAIREME